MHRPDHPDFWLISQGLIEQDSQGEQQGFEQAVSRYVDLEVLRYVVEQRTLRALGPASTRQARAKLGAMWIDGFLQGIRFQNLKTNPPLTPDATETIA